MVHKSLIFTLTLLATIMVAYVLVIGQNLLIPFIVALFIWQLLNTVANSIYKIKWLGITLPAWVCMLISIVLLGELIWAVINIISNNVFAVINAAPRYQDKFMQLINKLEVYGHIKYPLDISEFSKNLDLQSVFTNVYSVFTSLTRNAVLILLYIVFLFFEQKVLMSKVQAFFLQKRYRDLTLRMVHYIIRDTQIYLGIKTLTSVLTALLSWGIMRWVGLDFSAFWALLIFFLNFIPNIGAIIATVFPALLALIQFPDWSPFLAVTIGISAVQFFIGNLIEPRLMGNSLNLSPLVILISLGIWGSLWGVIGMFLSVPITVMMLIVFSHFEKTRGIAVLLSRDGTLKTYASSFR